VIIQQTLALLVAPGLSRRGRPRSFRLPY